jgi:hypothetical protein
MVETGDLLPIAERPGQRFLRCITSTLVVVREREPAGDEARVVLEEELVEVDVGPRIDRPGGEDHTHQTLDSASQV